MKILNINYHTTLLYLLSGGVSYIHLCLHLHLVYLILQKKF